jgi:flagellar biosynthesis protein FliQ
VIALAGPWMLGKLMGYTDNLFQSIPTLVGP